MIHILLTALILILPSTSVACSSGKTEQGTAPAIYSWRRVIEPGKGCFQESGCASGQWAMAIVPLVAFEKLFIVGRKEVWSSADGINWTSQAKTDWGERHGVAHVFFDNKMWMTGGMQSWTTRGAEHSVVFDGKLWVFGGKTGRADSWVESGDVWIMSPQPARNHALR